MIIYNNVWLANLLIREEAEKARKADAIITDEQKKIAEKYPVGFYTPNIFIRVGLFILTCIIVLFSGGLITLMASDMHIIDTWGYYLFLGIITYISLEAMVKSNNHYKSGVDDALMWISGGLFVAAFIIIQFKTTNDISYSRISFFIFLLSLYYAMRFTDMLMTAVSLLALIVTTFSVWNDLYSLGMSTMPFLIMIVCSGFYFLSKGLIGKKSTIHYTNCLSIVQIISLLILYFAGNYLVVQSLSTTENYGGTYGLGDPKQAKVPFASFFWIWTIALPFAYIYLGLRKKNVILLRSGLLLIAIAVFTFRTYYHVIPVEGALCIIGAILLGLSYGVIKYLKTPKHGFTYEDLNEDNLMDKLKVESLIVSETFSGTQVENDQTRFGGGDFGGGGASGNF